MMFYQYLVVEFLEFPHPGIDKYVCVPSLWIRWREKQGNRVAVAYPDGDLSHTKQLIRNHQCHCDNWKIYIAFLKYSTDFYNDAIHYIQAQYDDVFPKLIPSASTRQRQTSVESQLMSVPSPEPQVMMDQFNDDEYQVNITVCRRSPPKNIDMEVVVKRLREEEKIQSIADAEHSGASTNFVNGTEFPANDDLIIEYSRMQTAMKNPHKKRIKKKARFKD